jgi:hypothetical protein
VIVRTLRVVALSLLALPPLALLGCDRPLVPAVTPDVFSVHSASSFAVDLGFDRPLERASATQASRYALIRPTGDRVAPIRATLIDSLFGQTVRLFFPFGTLEDSTAYRMTVTGMRDVWGRALTEADSTTAGFETGLWHSRPIREVLARKCDPCHNAAHAGGNFRTDSYEALFENGSDAQSSDPRPNLVPGDARCILVIRTTPKHSMFNIAHLSYAESQLFINWVVTYQARR